MADVFPQRMPGTPAMLVSAYYRKISVAGTDETGNTAGSFAEGYCAAFEYDSTEIECDPPST